MMKNNRIEELKKIFQAIECDELSLRDLIYYDEEINNIFEELKQCKEDIIKQRNEELDKFINRGF